jgi:hypothetical protein
VDSSDPSDSGEPTDAASDVATNDAGGSDSGGDANVDASPPVPIVLASGLYNPARIAVNATTVFWSTEAPPDAGPGFGSVSINGGTASWSPMPAQPFGIAANATDVYTTSPAGRALFQTSLSGTTTMYSSSNADFAALAIDSNNAYWSDSNDGLVLQMSLNGDAGSVETLASGQGAVPQIAVDSSSIYWTNGNGNVLKVAIGGTFPTTLFTGSGRPGTGIAVDSTGVYWTNNGSGAGSGFIAKCPLTGCVGNAPSWAITGLSTPGEIVTDGTNVYWTSGGAAPGIYSATINGATHSLFAPARANGLAIDTANIYWTDLSAGTVSKLTKL